MKWTQYKKTEKSTRKFIGKQRTWLRVAAGPQFRPRQLLSLLPCPDWQKSANLGSPQMHF